MLRALVVLIRNLLVLLIAFLGGVLRLLRRGPKPEWVSYELGAGLVRGLPGDERSWVLRGSGKPHTLVEFARQLRYLESLPWVRGVVLRFDAFAAAGPVRDELRRVLAAFQAAGKSVVVHADHLDTRDWWLASVAERIWITPRGRLELVGFAANATAAGGLLAKLGVRVEVVRAGRFKSAGELLGAEKVSAENIEQTDELIGDLFDRVVGDASSSRGVSPEVLKGAIDDGPYSAARALETKLIDGVCYSDEVRKTLGEMTGTETKPVVKPFSAVLARSQPPLGLMPLFDRRRVVAVVDVDGIIAEGRNGMIPGMGRTAGSRSLVDVLNRLRGNERVAAVVLRIDSRGGSALASDLIWHAVKRLDAKKPVVAFLDSVAASGGYYIAAGARNIVASPVCMTGSIGVFSLRPDISGLFSLAGVDRVPVLKGARSAILDMSAPLDESARAALQRDVDGTWADFAQVVAEGRHLPIERARELADGRVVLAPRAVELGLVDSLGTLDDAIAVAAREASLDCWRVSDATPHESRLAQLRRMVRPDQEARALLRVFSGPGLFAYWPGDAPR